MVVGLLLVMGAAVGRGGCCWSVGFAIGHGGCCRSWGLLLVHGGCHWLRGLLLVMGAAVVLRGLLLVHGGRCLWRGLPRPAGLPAAPSTSAPGVCHACSVIKVLSRTGLVSGCAGPAQLWVRLRVTIRVTPSVCHHPRPRLFPMSPWVTPGLLLPVMTSGPTGDVLPEPWPRDTGHAKGWKHQLTLLFLLSVGVRIAVSGHAAFSMRIIFPQYSSFGAEHVKTTCPM